MDIRSMRKKLGMSVPAFSKRYGIPVRTLENWDSGIRKPPEYVFEMLEKKVIQDITILDTAEKCAENLNIKCPKISFGLDGRTSGNIAATILDSNKKVKEIMIINDYNNILDALLAVCHEMRHIYQSVYDEHILDGYIELGSGISFEAYNLQAAEVDANAYASLFIQANFGIKPLFQNFQEPVRKKIEKRIDFLRKNA